jgi:hypothetical protein
MRSTQVGWRPLAAAGMLLFATQVQTFMPSDNKEFLFGDNGISHQSQTRSAYNDLIKKYWGDFPFSTSMQNARKELEEANMAVDDDQDHSEKHFDGENFDGGQARLINLKKQALAAVKANDGSSARTYIGGALHTLQDFYAHSNWVEIAYATGNVDINHDLGIEGKSIAHADFSTTTCRDCVGLDAEADIIAICLDCTSNVFLDSLTSGYYNGEDAPFVDPATGKKPDIPDHKCHHGKFL